MLRMPSSPSRRRSSTAKYPRTARINESLREVIATTLEKVGSDDPRLELVTVTAVKTETDLRNATVFFSALDTDADMPQVIEALESKRKVLQGAVGRNVRMKHTPLLHFQPDTAITEGQRIEDLLGQIPPYVEQPDLELPDIESND